MFGIANFKNVYFSLFFNKFFKRDPCCPSEKHPEIFPPGKNHSRQKNEVIDYKQKRASNHDQFRLTPVNGKRTQQSNCREAEDITEAHEKNARIIFDGRILFNFTEIRMIINCVPCELPFRHIMGQFFYCFHRRHLKKTWVRESHIFF